MQKWALVNSTTNWKKPRLRERGQTELGLVAFYDIQPGNGAGLFLQLWSPHGALFIKEIFFKHTIYHSAALLAAND